MKKAYGTYVISSSKAIYAFYNSKGEKGAEGLSKEIMAENSPNLRKEMAYKFQTLNEFQLV